MEFLKAHGLDPDALNPETLLADFRDELRSGLAGEGPVPMIPAGFCLSCSRPQNTTIPAFDVGGTNTRSARIHFDAMGVPTVQNQINGLMPGSREAVDYTDFYRQLCEVLVPNIHANERLGYCFSYPVDSEGKLAFWTKSIQAPSILGTHVGKDLQAALAERGIKHCDVRVLNDTVAVLLAAYAHHCDHACAGYVGFILGTGMNISYAEHARNIPKYTGTAEGFMPINCEAGNITKFPHSDFDLRYEAQSGDGHAQLERCCSGVHLGPICTEVLRSAADVGLLSASVREQVMNNVYPNVDLDRFCAGTSPDVIQCSEKEAETIRSLVSAVFRRSATFSSVMIAAAALASAEARGETSGLLRINIDGSTFWKTATVPFVDLVKQHLTALLEPRGFTYEIVRIKDAPLIGAALAAHED